MSVAATAVLDVLVRYPLWPHVPRGVTASQVARFASMVMQGATFYGWPDDATPRAVAALQTAPWDSEKIGVPAARLFVTVPPDAPGTAAPLLARVLAEADGAGIKYLVTRIDAGDVAVIQAMEQAGFIVVDAILSQYLRPAAAPPPAQTDMRVRPAEPDDAEVLAGIADACFTMSRFHGDPWIGVDKARSVYRDWARNIARGLNDVNVVAVLDGAVVGFLSCKDVPPARSAYGIGYGRIELVAVTPAARGRGGVGAMTRRLIDEAPARSWDLLGIGTQIANVQAMRAYQHAGFVPGDSIFTLRRLV